MKKTILSLLLASVVAASAFGMVACGDNDDGINGNTDPATIKSEQVADEAAWKAAFDYSEVKNYSLKMTMVTKRGDLTTRENEGTLGFDTDKYISEYTSKSLKYDYLTGEYVKENDEYVYETYASQSAGAVIDGKYYEYEYDDEEEAWYREESDDEFENDMTSLKELKDAYNGYAKFTFENGAYTATFNEDDNEYAKNIATKITIKIKDGKVIYVSYLEEYDMIMDEDGEETEHNSYEQTLLIYGVGTTMVGVPAEYKEYEEDAE
ncbi:MAG: hypothetical protein HDT28_02150 [Clostridiales bacterium]|nr:hypothetical protein [Clostridiales bacterium]